MTKNATSADGRLGLASATLAPIVVDLTSTPSEHYEPLHSTRRRYAAAATPKMFRTPLIISRLDQNHAAHTPQDGSAQVR